MCTFVAEKLKTTERMDDEIKDEEILEQQESEDVQDGHSDYKPVNRFDAAAVHHLSGMYQNWFLDYASYVILERAVPHLGDGLKPVQRRILHSMKRMDDGRYNKVANIVGHTMQFHPHGDASIGDALVQMGQKDLLIDTQGNWGNILTGSSAAAPRYIEARLSKFALDCVFNPKTTEWKMSYDIFHSVVLGLNTQSSANFDRRASMYRGAAAEEPVRMFPQLPCVSIRRSFWPICTRASPMEASP